MSIIIAPLFALPLFTATLYLSSICPMRPHCFLLTTSPSSQTLYCESTLICSFYRCLLIASISIVLATVAVGFAWAITTYGEYTLLEGFGDMDPERGWSENLNDEDTDCEDDAMQGQLINYKD